MLILKYYLKKGPVFVRRLNGNFDEFIICLLIILLTIFCNIINKYILYNYLTILQSHMII